MRERTNLTKHARERAGERLGLTASESHSVLNALWSQGRSATPNDFQLFGTLPLPGFAYRVTQYRTRRVLLVQDTVNRCFVTLRTEHERKARPL